jgi:erythromycin esterase-like protein
MKPVLSLVVLTALGLPAAQSIGPKPAVPIDPIKAILDAFQSHSIVALGEPHGNEQAAAFRVALIRDPRFAGVVNDIVVESGNSRFQDVVDAFVSGQQVPDTTLRQTWQNTTVANFVWDRPIYEQFFRTVRDVNAVHPHQLTF